MQLTRRVFFLLYRDDVRVENKTQHKRLNRSQLKEQNFRIFLLFVLYFR